MTYDIKNHKRGDTFMGVAFEVLVNSVAIDLTDCEIDMHIRKSPKDSLVLGLSIGSGLEIIDAVSGRFAISEQIVDIPPCKYVYDIQITFTDGTVKTWIEGTWTIEHDVTRA